MANWPLPSDFSKSLQNPQVTLRDPELRACQIERDPSNNQPVPRAGGFAVVYKAHLPATNEFAALRVFKSGLAERLERYNAISSYLDSLKLSCLVKFRFYEKGVMSLSDGRLYPLVRMDWIQGQTLQEWVRAKCLARDGPALTQLAEKWVQLMADLASVQLAHGDLQHGNVMVTHGGELKLVDYDCMCVPALHGRVNTELGLPPYQHRQRDETTKLSVRLDDFSALFILLALRALAADTGLYTKYVEKPGEPPHETLLMRGQDFKERDKSALYSELLRSQDADVRELAVLLFESYHKPIDQVPPVSEALNSYREIEELLRKKDWGAAVKCLNKKTPQQRAKMPAGLQGQAKNAEDRVAALAALDAAVARGDEAAMVRCYVPAHLDDFPQALPAVQAAREAPAVLQALHKLEQLRQKKDWRGLVEAWSPLEQILDKRQSCAGFRDEVRQWRVRNQACDAFQALRSQPGVDEAALLASWQQLQLAGGHPDAEGHRAAMERLAIRSQAWAVFRQLPNRLDEETDRSLVDAWKESLFAKWPEAERERRRVQEAQGRLKILAQLQRLDGTAAPTVVGEQALVQLGGSLPGGYLYARQERVRLASQRLQVQGELLAALAKPGADQAVVSAWRRLTNLHGENLAPPGSLPQLQMLDHRVPAWNDFQRVAQVASEENDRMLCEAWKEDLFAGWPVAERERPRLSHSQSRLAVVAKIAQLDEGSPTPQLPTEQGIAQLAGLLPAGYEYELQERSAAALGRLRGLSAVRRALQKKPVSEAELADAWSALAGAGGETLVGDAERQRALLAAERAARLQALADLDRRLSAEERDEQILERFDAELFAGCEEARKWEEQYQLAAKRQKAVRLLSEVLAGRDGDDLVIVALARLLKDYSLAPDMVEPIRAATARVEKAEAIVDVLRRQQEDRFRDVFDVATVRRYQRLFKPHEALLRKWLESSVLSLNHLGMACPDFGRLALVPLPSEGSLKVVWKWPVPKLTDQCLLAVCRSKPRPQDRDPERLNLVFQQPIPRKGWEGNNASWRLHPEDTWGGSWVVVWAVIDLGWTQCYGEPLTLGRVTQQASPKRRF